MYGIGMFLTGIFNCTPIKGFWDKTVSAKCVSFEKYVIGVAVVNITTDVVIWILPIPMIWRLHLKKGQKLLLTFVFLLGLFVWAASFVRLFTSIFILSNPDTTYAYYPGFIWSVVEPSVAVICACLITMNVLLKRIFSKTLSSRYFGSNSYGRDPTSAQSFPSSHKCRVWPKSADYADLDSEQLSNLDPTLDYQSTIAKAERGQMRSLKEQVTGDGISVTRELHIERE
ncbi:MAG: hypothetical protein M1820_002964 [Bogoriella megaspora]|nr:MAG: hypothetical protein M1820_002964 [Bogoriella megaspora]